MIKELAKK